MDVWTVTEARAALPAILERVEDGAEVALTRHGKVVAVVMRPDQARARRTSELHRAASDLHAEMEIARGRPLVRVVMDHNLTEQRVAELRADRDAG